MGAKKIESIEFSELKHKVRIETVIKHYCSAEITGKGNKLKCYSPFKSEKTPSCIIYTDTNSFYDYSTNKGGDIVTLVSLLFGLKKNESARKIMNDFSVNAIDSKKPCEGQFHKVNHDTKEIEFSKQLINQVYHNLTENFKMFRDMLEILKKGVGLDIENELFVFVINNLVYFENISLLFADMSTKEQLKFAINYIKENGGVDDNE